MTLEFDDWDIEIYISSWISLKADICQEPGPRWSRGVLDNGPLDRVGSPTTLKFELRNDACNSAGLTGRYSPGHTNCLTGFTTGIPCRLWFEFEGRRFYKFYGLIEPNGISPTAGIYGERRTKVSVQNFMAQAASHEMNLTTKALNKRIDEAVPLIVANMIVQPLATQYNTGNDTFPTVFDALGVGSSASSEFGKLAMSEFGFIYDKGDETGGETLVVEGRDTRSNVSNTQLPLTVSESGILLLEDGGELLLEDAGSLVLSESQPASFDNTMLTESMRVSYGKHQANRIRGITAVRKVDAAATTTLYRLPSAIQLTAGTPLTVRGTYRDPNGGASYVNADTSTMTNDYAAFANSDGTGADLTASLSVVATYGTSEVEFVLTPSANMWVTQLDAIGKGIYLYDPLSVIYEDTNAQNAGVFQITFDMAYQDDPRKTDAFANYTLGLEKTPNVTVDRCPIMANISGMHMYGFLMLEPGTRANFKEDQTGIDGDYFINGYEAEMFAGRYVIFSPVLRTASNSSFAIWDVSQWDNSSWGFPD